MSNYFTELNSINVNDKVEKKNGLSFLAWAYAWGEVKKRHPKSFYTIYENENGWNYFTDGRTAWVKTGVTIVLEEGVAEEYIEHIEYLPIMDFRNKSIPLEQITSFDVNKAIQRSLTKAVARHGLGLYIYAGEDLPEDDKNSSNQSFSKTENTSILQLINNCKTEDELSALYKENKALICNNPNLLDIITKKGKELRVA